MKLAQLISRIPKPRRSFNSKFVAAGAILAVMVLCSVVYRFHKLNEQKEVRRNVQQTASVASDAAVPVPLHGTVASYEPQAITPGGASTYGTLANAAQPLKDAGQQIVQPFGSAQQQAAPAATAAVTYPAPMNYSQPVANPQEDERELARKRELTRRQQAQEAPTGISTQQQSSNPLPSANNIASSFADQMQAIDGYLKPHMPPASVAAVESQREQNAVSDKDRFAQQADRSPGYILATRVPQPGKFVLQRGTHIPATLNQVVNAELPGDLTATVSRDVFDTATGKHVLIPGGSRLIGEYNSHVGYGQKSVQIAWTAIYFPDPDGTFIDLGKMPAHAADGSAGVSDQVDNHLKRLIGGVLISSALSAGLSVSQNRSSSGSVLTYPSAGQQAAAAVGTQATELGSQITSRNLNVQPRLKVRPGAIMDVFVTRSILFADEYKQARR